ncbi:hemerythrin domain-containing protein [Neobacillus niacini]|uniref:hemerythrin domain-containing protein n=1 Tax=Neobacillus niacini TaxID=86668 RepID=UPI002857478F|nr:hemerythrin domain-containing protein [Neobacillus niacini]MDR6998290.1 L-2-hydroxyglutarate oxidase LhgO [Neobacillus niacini]
MSGPSLRKKHSHHSIHDGIYTEARDLTVVLKELVKEGENDKIKEVAEALIEHWETRTLAHAQSEEEGFFVEKLKEQPELNETIIKLKRDHQLLELIVAMIKEKMKQNGMTVEMTRYFDALLVLFELHNLEEEKYLFTEE